jgi:hypothetical protein
MRIGIVGGVEKSSRFFAQAARERGHELVAHGGDMAGRGRESLENLIDRAGLVVVLTDVNSHGAVLYARKYARQAGRRCVLLRRLGVQRFRALLERLESGGLEAEEHCRRPDSSRLPQ